MNYFVTGGTGFVGRFLLEKLLQRGGTVYVLTRNASHNKFESLRHRLAAGPDKLIPVFGDLTQPQLGLSESDIENLNSHIEHFFHVAAIYDLKANEADQHAANVNGTRNAIDCATALGARCFQYVSSVAVSGMYVGTFTEDMFDEAENLANAYYRSKHDGEAVLRQLCSIPWRIYRPSGILGHSRTGEIDKIDGPYYSFPMIKKLRFVPGWLPLPGVSAGSLNLVPVDYVVNAMDHIAHQPDLDGSCFHLTNTQQYDATEMTNIFAKAAGASTLSIRAQINPAGAPWGWILSIPFLQKIGGRMIEAAGIPLEALKMMQWDTRYDCTATLQALQGSGITLPKLEVYASTLWNYWEQNLDPDRARS